MRMGSTTVDWLNARLWIVLALGLVGLFLPINSRFRTGRGACRFETHYAPTARLRRVSPDPKI